MQPSRTSSPPSSLITPEKVDPQTHTMGLVIETDLNSLVTCVGGILVTKQQNSSTGAIVSDTIVVRKPVFGSLDQVRDQLGCTATEYS